ncbi:pantoate--beta-alanine ligase [Acetobacter nitrogenifigens DSM 23921 = NBRC 105050]|uniref:Pantothenate synthetase n=1 Tax=Acetobacter nitrogenifigens DSM 23921 = NBRC 105050 TaxID=1120919 RepID=A0A511X914_9PROT|nr:pantoate--beta-alanine ligase [Acetobacter nitrogenifigens]GBQ87097.1 pantoate--beta-alanine ligase [Acetobacter nitrogenifigens DSM 23921 = NBRC 105050]GEN59440.1 pantothenate synthetase [Acetobacter nitrogenifigens DSM 23921 = NBRC 105050]
MIFRTVSSLQAQIAAWKAEGATIGLTPTMGALHDGHLSLVKRAREQCDRVIVSIFVNPTQFNNAADLETYPRCEDRDVALLGGVDAVFIPSVAEMYPEGFISNVHVGGLSERLEGAHRPGHFDGMATVVMKLFNISKADAAFFGEKDWQQLQIVRRMVKDFNHSIRIEGGATLREADGLAMSSRNQRLGEDARRRAPALYAALQKVADVVRSGATRSVALDMGTQILRDSGFENVDYLDVCDAMTLTSGEKSDGSLRVLAAAWLDGVRLIDNLAV